jgi:hypothetical protein
MARRATSAPSPPTAARQAVKQFSRTGFEKLCLAGANQLRPAGRRIRPPQGVHPGRSDWSTCSAASVVLAPSAACGRRPGRGRALWWRSRSTTWLGRAARHSTRGFDESQIFRIVTTWGRDRPEILVFRPGNSMFERVRGTATPSVGADHGGDPSASRPRVLREAGAIRDIVENHVLQVLAVSPWASGEPRAGGHP